MRWLRDSSNAAATRRSAAIFATAAIYGSYAYVAYQAVGGKITYGDLVMYFQAFQRVQGFLHLLLASLAQLYLQDGNPEARALAERAVKASPNWVVQSSFMHIMSTTSGNWRRARMEGLKPSGSAASSSRAWRGETWQVAVRASAATKCERCWHWRDDVGRDPAHPAICGRCTSNLHGAGEIRTVA